MRRRAFRPLRVLTPTGWWIVAFAGATALTLAQIAMDGKL